jgi:hypothetical protein
MGAGESPFVISPHVLLPPSVPAGSRSRRVRRGWLALAGVVLLWSLALRITGGFAIDTPWRLISSRNSVRPLIAGLALVAWYLLVWRRHWREDLGRFSRGATWPPFIAGVATLVALIVGFGWGTKIGAGPDQSGYVSLAARLTQGAITMPAPPWSTDAPWDDAAYTASPVGWHPTTQTHILGPTYSAGLPMMMAAFQIVAGPDAVFYVVPLVGALMVWSAYVLGTRLSGPWAGAIGAALTLSSPIFLMMQLQAMSDVPAAGFVTASLAAAAGAGNPWLAGLATAGAILARPNLVPLVAIPLALLMLRRERRIAAVVSFAIPVAIASAIVGAINWRLYGSPVLSGYGNLSTLYAWSNTAVNTRQYFDWFARTQTLFPVVGIFAVLVAGRDRRARLGVLLATAGVPFIVLALYLPYSVFGPNDWGYLRFLLPAYPSVFVGAGIVVAAVVTRAHRRRLAAVAALLVIGVLIAHGWRLSVVDGLFMQRVGDARFAVAAEYAKALPERSVLISNAHSGTLHFYTGRDVLRFEAIRPADLDVIVSHLKGLGYSLHFIGDEFETAQFRTRFAGSSALAAMSTKPRAAFQGVEAYDFDEGAGR